MRNFPKILTVCNLTASTFYMFIYSMQYDKDYYQTESIKSKDLIQSYISLLENSGVTLKGKTVCDIGCASGNFIAQLNEAQECLGIDISNDIIEHCKEKFSGNLKYSFICHNISKGNLSIHKKFDIITLFDVIEHLQNFEYLQNFIFESLNPNGFIVITTPNASSLQRLLLGNHKFNGEKDPTHLFTFTPYTFDFFIRRFQLIRHTVFYPFGFYMKNNWLTQKIPLGAIIFGIYKLKQPAS